MKSNLHSVLFEPKSTRLWVAHASARGEPAVTQPYHAFQLTELLTRSFGEVPPTEGMTSWSEALERSSTCFSR